MAKQRLRYRLYLKEGHTDKLIKEGWTWIGEDIPLEIVKRIGPFKATLKGHIETFLEPGMAPEP